MHQHIALLRGINVSGHKIIKMADLRALFEESGFTDVKTFIQSGNILFSSTEKSAEAVAARIKKILLDQYGFDVGVVMLSEAALRKAIADNPFAKEPEFNIKQLYVVFLSEKPEEDNVAKIDLAQFEPDAFIIADKVIYIRFADTSSNSKLNNNFLENKLKVTATTRNWNSTLKLMALLEGTN